MVNDLVSLANELKIYTKENLAKYFDHTNLKTTARLEDIKKLCGEAKNYNFAAVCIPPYYVRTAKAQLKDTNVAICTVVGFPLGYNLSLIKSLEAYFAIGDGADEIDMVINRCLLKSKDYVFLERDIEQVSTAVHNKGKILKVILETCELTEEEIIKACEAASNAGAEYVKTSTGFGNPIRELMNPWNQVTGATVEAVELMKETVPNLKVKAAGGISDLETALKMIKSGADRLGCSASVKIMEKYLNLK